MAAIKPVRGSADEALARRKKALDAARRREDETRRRRPRKDEMDALILFKSDMAAFQRLYTFLSQIFDYGNTDIEKRAHLLPAG